MPLTPEAVRNKQFTPTRFRPGYDEDEVDVFLDEVEAELTRLLSENSDLRAQLAAGPSPAPVAPAPEPAVAATAPAEDPGSAALRTLQLAQRTAEEAVAQARAEADSIIGEARGRAARLQDEAQQQRVTVIGDLERRRAALEAEVAELRAFEVEYRSRLRAYLESQLRTLEGQEEAAPGTGADRSGDTDAAEDDLAESADGRASADGAGRHRVVRLAEGGEPVPPPAAADHAELDIDEGPEPPSSS